MAQTSGFFNANIVEGVADRAYSAIDFAKYFAAFIGNGVFAHNLEELRVVPSSNNMQVIIKPGRAFCNGYWYNSDSNVAKQLTSNSSTTMSRWDAIVLNFNFSTRVAELSRITGSLASTYEAGKQAIYNGLSRDLTSLYQLCLAIVEVPKNASTYVVSAANIYDVRAEEYCGWVTGLVDQLDTSTIVTQLQASFEAWFETSTAQFDAWFEAIEGQLSEDAAGNLQNQISVINQQILRLTPVTLYETPSDASGEWLDGHRIYFSQTPLDFDEITIHYLPTAITHYMTNHNAIACQAIIVRMPTTIEDLLSKAIHAYYVYTNTQDEDSDYYSTDTYQHRIYELYGVFKKDTSNNRIYLELNSCYDSKIISSNATQAYHTLERDSQGSSYISQVKVMKIVGYGNRQSSASPAAVAPYNETQTDSYTDSVQEVTE